MDVTIVGAGAVGMLTACLLQESGQSVTLLTRRKEQADAINACGIVKNGETVRVKAVSDWHHIPSGGIIFVAVKYDSLGSLLPRLKKMPPDRPLVFLQNGMMHLVVVRQLPQTNVAAGSVEHGAVRTSDREILHTGFGVIKFAAVKGQKEPFLPLLSAEGFQSEWHTDADRLLFRKVLLNCLINPLTAMLSIKNGELLTNEPAYCLLRSLYAELASAFAETEKLLPLHEVEALCRSTAANTSSMLADRLAGRRMELDTIVGYTLQRSEQDMPRLRVLYYLLKATEV